jgi:hypothetical protein
MLAADPAQPFVPIRSVIMRGRAFAGAAAGISARAGLIVDNGAAAPAANAASVRNARLLPARVFARFMFGPIHL